MSHCFFAIALFGLIGCHPLPYATSYSTSCADTGPEPFTIEGNAAYNQTLQPGVRVFLVNKDNILIDQATTDYAGYYSVETTEPGNVTLLAGFDSTTPLMSVTRLSLDVQVTESIVHIDLSPVNNDADTGVNPLASTNIDSCTCEAAVWNFALICCDEESSDSTNDSASESIMCSWEWDVCDE